MSMLFGPYLNHAIDANADWAYEQVYPVVI
jgi:hypothetical protein